MPIAKVHRISAASPDDVSGIETAIAAGRINPKGVLAVLGKTEGNGLVNDYARGYAALALKLMFTRHLGVEPADKVCLVMSGGTEGVLSPHYVVLARSGTAPAAPHAQQALANGTAIRAALPAEQVWRNAHVQSVAAAVKAAMAEAHISDPRDVHFVQVKCPCITSARAESAKVRGQTVVTTDPNRSMALARAAGAFGVALALGEIEAVDESAMLRDFGVLSNCASISSGVEVEANEVIVLGNSRHWSGDLVIAHRPMADALDIGGVVAMLGDLGIEAKPQVSAGDLPRVRAVFVKCEPDRRGAIRGQRHTMLDDTDINAQRHVRGALGGLVAAVIGDGRIFVSGGAEHQGPDGGGPVALIVDRAVD